jgi:hypothetical protein
MELLETLVLIVAGVIAWLILCRLCEGPHNGSDEPVDLTNKKENRWDDT